ncbi:MAG TPA: MerR family transcriptional regulator [Armatimonadetes bacterium]|nr:MerR family transcriptional regulator [Armatimonadota bacterium]
MAKGQSDRLFCQFPKRPDTTPLYTIGVVSRMLNIHPQTLRMYERLGLVKPARTEGNTRLYSEADVERIRRIQFLTKELGVNLAGVEVIFDLLEKIEQMQRQMREEMERRTKEMEEEIRRLRRLLGKVVRG